MNDIFWLSEAVIKAMHEEQLAEHGGLIGIRDRNLLLALLQSDFAGLFKNLGNQNIKLFLAILESYA